MQKIRFHAGFIFLTLVVAAGLGWCIGTQEFARWTQNFAEMDVQDPVLTNAPLVKYEKSFDLGVLYGEVGTVTHDFPVTNTGRSVLKLSDPIPEDESVTCVLPKNEVAPDETIYVTVSCTPKTDEEEIDASVLIQTNVKSEPEMEISLVGSVHAAVWPEEAVVEVAGVPTMSIFKTANRIYSLVKNQPLELSNFHVKDPKYAEFFSFEQTDAYHHEFSDVIPAPEYGKIVTIAIKPGLPNQILSVTVEGETNIPETPVIQFNIDFKLPQTSAIPGVPGGLVPIIPAETPAAETPGSETPTAETPAAETPGAETPGAEPPAAETPAVPEKIDLESDSE